MGMALVAGRNRVPRPAAGMTAVRMRSLMAARPLYTTVYGVAIGERDGEAALRRERVEGASLTEGSGRARIGLAVLDGELAVPCTRNPL